MRGGTTTGAAFREARRHEDELNERQREVLALVAEGLTNAEIGERLGITLDGAKWNVSEILTKLGLASREEAAEYWRWRHGGAWSRVRGLFGAPLLRIAGAGAATVLGVGVVAALMSHDEPPVVDEPGRPFYLEAEIRVSSSARTIGTNIAGATPAADPDESRSTLRWAWQDADHFRAVFETTEPTDDGEATLILGDGRSMWVYREPDGTYSETALYPMPDAVRARPITFSILLGALPLPTYVDTVDEFMAALEEWHEEEGTSVRVVGEDELLGRRVVVIETGPAYCYSGGSQNAQGTATSTEGCEGSSQLWLDPATMLVLRHAVQSSIQSFDAVVTRLDYDTDFEPSRFSFVPPPGATRDEDADSGSSSETTSPGAVPTPGE